MEASYKLCRYEGVSIFREGWNRISPTCCLFFLNVKGTFLKNKIQTPKCHADNSTVGSSISLQNGICNVGACDHFFPLFFGAITVKCLKGCEMFVTCYIVLSKAAFRPQTTACTRTPRTWHFELNKREQITQTRHISILSFLPGHVPTMQLLIYDFFRGSTNHDETLNPLFSRLFPFSLGEGEKKNKTPHIKCPSAHEHRNN